MPKKPTKPFGYVALSKKGRVRKVISMLSENKLEQEQDAMDLFISTYNRSYNNKIELYVAGVEDIQCLK